MIPAQNEKEKKIILFVSIIFNLHLGGGNSSRTIVKREPRGNKIFNISTPPHFHSFHSYLPSLKIKRREKESGGDGK